MMYNAKWMRRLRALAQGGTGLVVLIVAAAGLGLAVRVFLLAAGL